MDMDDGSEGAPAAMETVTLGQIIHNNRDRLIYLFDMFGDRAYFLELTGAYEMPKDGSYPREIYARRMPPTSTTRRRRPPRAKARFSTR